MPRYDFRCTPCQWTFEAAIPFGSDELPQCPQCGKSTVEKVISPPLGIHFRGSGFYKTDSRMPQKEKSTEPAPTTSPEKSKPPETPKTEKPKEAPQKEKKGV